MRFEERNEKMALALALSNYGAEGIGDEARDPQDGWTRMMWGLMECGHAEDEAERIIDQEVRDWLHAVEVAEPYALKRGKQLLERFAWTA